MNNNDKIYEFPVFIQSAKEEMHLYYRLTQINGAALIRENKENNQKDIIFGSLNKAKMCRNILRSEGFKVGNDFIKETPIEGVYGSALASLLG